MVLSKPSNWAPLLSRAASFQRSRKAALCTRSQSERGDLRAAVLDFEDALPYARAADLPASWYTQRSFHSLEISAIYNSRWVGVGSVHSVSSAGSYFTGTIGNEPYLVVNDGSSVNAFYNICPHRGSLLVRSNSGTASSFECGNHGRTYSLDGCLLKRAPLEATNPSTTNGNAHRSSDRLVPAAVAQCGPAVLVHLHEPADSSQMNRHIVSDNISASMAGCRLLQSTQFQACCNWKLIVEKYLQMRAPHGQTLQLDSYFPDRRSTKAPTCAVSTGGAQSLTYIYPNVFIEYNRDGILARYITPLDMNLCSLTVDYFVFTRASSEGESKRSEKDLVGQDQAETRDRLKACEDMQKGMLSRHSLAARSRAAAVDARTHDFHLLLADDLKEALRLKFDTTI